ncbi:YwaF family protein [Streptococcus massiliensis]|uniref:Major facilitator superfamily permease n=1 Tax=Streptococcus massiliensis TaxID=313439 RepID=A0A380L1R0_9STRE|nr:YwaF family protein [Streptococcus massiliensis]SUN77520.1 major facilitator superfamily permease [Streptococcus massiliensis]
MFEFFTTHKSEVPQLTPFWYGMMLLGVVAVFYTSLKYSQSPTYSKLFRYMQFVQLFSLYAWYGLTLAPLAESLPLYHCRMAMFAVLFLPNRSPYKQYFALLGIFGPICALVHPIFDPYPFPHLTLFSYLIGHYALLGNSLIYLANYYDKNLLTKERLIYFTLGMNAFLLLVNQVTRGDYGFLTNPPLVGNQGLLLNFILVSLVLIIALLLEGELYKKVQDKRDLSFQEDL